MRISTANVRQLARKQGLETVPDLVRAVLTADPDGKGVSANSLKRFWHDDASLVMYHQDVLLLLCLALECQPGDILKLAPPE